MKWIAWCDDFQWLEGALGGVIHIYIIIIKVMYLPLLVNIYIHVFIFMCEAKALEFRFDSLIPTDYRISILWLNISLVLGCVGRMKLAPLVQQVPLPVVAGTLICSFKTIIYYAGLAYVLSAFLQGSRNAEEVLPVPLEIYSMRKWLWTAAVNWPIASVHALLLPQYASMMIPPVAINSLPLACLEFTCGMSGSLNPVTVHWWQVTWRMWVTTACLLERRSPVG